MSHQEKNLFSIRPVPYKGHSSQSALSQTGSLCFLRSIPLQLNYFKIIGVGIGFALATAAGSSARADFFHDAGQWVGDRTGLRKPVEELSGEAERQRTERARIECAEAENQLKAAAAELASKKAELQAAEYELHSFQAQILEQKEKTRQLVQPFLSQLFTLQQVTNSLNETHRTLTESRDRFLAQINQINGALTKLLSAESADDVTLSQYDAEFISVLQGALHNPRIEREILGSVQNDQGVEYAAALMSKEMPQRIEDIKRAKENARTALEGGAHLESLRIFSSEALTPLRDTLAATRATQERLVDVANSIIKQTSK